MYRVYDKKKKKFVKDNIFLTPEGELVESKKSLFGNKLTFVLESRYVFQQAIGLDDKNGQPIYVGDYLEAELGDGKMIQGLVTFSEELAAYIILYFETNNYFVLGQSFSERIRVIGNVFKEPSKG